MYKVPGEKCIINQITRRYIDNGRLWRMFLITKKTIKAKKEKTNEK